MWEESRLWQSGILLAGTALALASSGHGTVQPLPVGPLHYFQSHCARCHGKIEMAGNSAFEPQRSDADLRKIVTDMAAGPGGSALSGRALEAELALHRAMTAKRPFLAWTQWKNGVLGGEAVPGSKVSVRSPAGSSVAILVGYEWTAKLPAGVLASTVTIEAALGGKKVKLELAKAAFSGAKP